MAEKWVQHIGDDQLVHGMPKHMSAAAGESASEIESEKSYYWTVHPKPEACDKCKAMAGIKYRQEPQRPHPNCKCEIKKHYIGVDIMGLLQGHGSMKTHSFKTGQKSLLRQGTLDRFYRVRKFELTAQIGRIQVTCCLANPNLLNSRNSVKSRCHGK